MNDDVRIIHGDCMDVLPTLSGLDAVLTDPPYGITRVWKGGGSCGWSRAKEATPDRNVWDKNPPSPEVFRLILSFNVPTIIWGGNYFDLPASRGWLVWNKPERNFTLAEAELAWTNLDTVIRVFDCPRSDIGRVHPTQKPLRLMAWCLKRLALAPGSVVVDPYAGSGTTGVACLKAGLRCILIEKNDRYIPIIKRRIREASMPLLSGLD